MNRLIKDNQKHFNRMQVVLDGCVIIVSYLISWYVMLRSVEGKAIGVLPPEFYMMVLVILVPFFLLLNYACGLYTPKRVQGRRLEGSNIVKANVIGGLGMMAAYFMLRLPDVSRLQIGLFLILNVALTFAERNIVRVMLMNVRRMGLNLKHILLVGYSRAAEEYIDRITQNPQWGYNVLGILDDHGNDIKHHAAHDDLKICNRHIMRFCGRTAQTHNRVCKTHARNTEHDACKNGHKQGVHECLICLTLIFLTLSSCHNRSNCHIHRDKYGKPEKFGLRGKPDCRHCLRTDAAYHQRVDHTGQ